MSAKRKRMQRAEIVAGIPRGDWRRIIGANLEKLNRENENKTENRKG